MTEEKSQRSANDTGRTTQSKDEIRRERDLFSRIMETSPAGIIVADLDGRIEFANAAAERVLGLREDDTKQQTYNEPEWHITDYDGEPVPDDDLPFRVIKRSKGAVYGMRNAIVWPDGRRVLLNINGAPLFDEAGEVERIVFSIEEVTRQIRSDAALRESEERFRRMAEGILDGLAIIERGRVVYVNNRLCEITGYPREELMHLSGLDLAAPEERDRVEQVMKEVRTGSAEIEELEYWIVRKDGVRRCIHNRYSLSRRAGEETGRYVITSDVTERKLLEEQLRHSQKMEAIGNLAGGVAHDFNNILTAVAGYTELLLGCTGTEDPRRRDVEEIKRATDRARALTSQLLALSRRQVLRPKVICINSVINIMASMLRRVIGEDIELVLDLDEGLARVMADPGQLEQVILNLAINARDAMPDGGQLAVRTKHIHLDEELSLSIPDARPGEYVLLEITDNGVGMERAVLERIFEPFFSTKEAGRGTGLGLATVYGIVKQHQGSIVAESEPGAGSSFRIYIPVHPEEQVMEEDGEISVEALRGAGEAVLLVEDDGEVRRFACRALGENGYTVFEARTAEEGIEICRREGRAFDLIISDIVLPGKTGLQMVEELLRDNNELRVMLISGYADQKIRWPEIRDRGFDFLQKPYALVDLLRAVRDAISR